MDRIIHDGEKFGPKDHAERVALRLRRLYRAWFGFRDESEAPYRDARMLLVSYVLAQATLLLR